MNEYLVCEIGKIRSDDNGFSIELKSEYRQSIEGLEGFGHIQVLWWFSGCDDAQSRATRMERSPYRKAPPTLGTFATRSPMRPNPIALSCASVRSIDKGNGVLWLDYIDAEDQSPVLDIKPYTPSLDRVETPTVPQWCAHWPMNVETSGEFDWANEFTMEG